MENDMEEMTDFRAEEQEECEVATSTRFNESEQRRIIALDMAIRVRGDMPDDESIVKTSRAFEAFLKGD
jgi:uncharacterized OsmC-like protein